VIQPVEAGNDRDGVIIARNAREIDHSVFVWPPSKEGLDHLGLPGWVDQQFDLTSGHHHHVAHRFDPGVFPDRANVAGLIGQGPGAGRIDQFAAVDAAEIIRRGHI
jgi:hypothetical protein